MNLPVLILLLTAIPGSSENIPVQYRAEFDAARWQDTEAWRVFEPDGSLPEDWNGSGWFLLTSADLDSDGLHLVVGGKVTVWLDGQPMTPVTSINHIGLPGSDQFSFYTLGPLFDLSEADAESRLLIYLETPDLDSPSYTYFKPKLHLLQTDVSTALTEHTELVRKITFHKMLLLGLLLSFTIIHLMLHLHYSEIKANAHFAALTLSGAAVVLGIFQIYLVDDFHQWVTIVRLITISFCLNIFFALTMTYSLTMPHPPKHFRYIVGFIVVIGIWGIVQPFLVYEFQGSVVLLGFAEILRVLFVEWRKNKGEALSGGRILAFGAMPAMASFIYQMILLNFPVEPLWDFFDFPLILYSTIPLLLSMSIFLSRRFAHVNRELTARELEQARLVAENDRKNKELEEARRLQLSMLPIKLPEENGYSIAAHMITATEVGGDYYDFCRDADGALIAVIGDATGHGLRAGYAVTATKSLFKALASSHEPDHALSLMGGPFKSLGFKNMFMAMIVVKWAEDHLRLAIGGMPAPLIYRAEGPKLEKIMQRGLPLGALRKARYNLVDVHLEQGDQMVLMSDGLAERFNQHNEMFGDERLEQTLLKAGHLTPAELIDTLIGAGEQWSEGKALDDDITFVVIRRD